MKKKFLTFLGFSFDEKKNYISGFTFLPFNWVIVIGGLALAISIIFTGFFVLDKTERAAVEVFGAYKYEVGPGGIHFKLPLVSHARKVPTEMRRRWELGFRTNDNGKRDEEIPSEATMLTKGGQLGSIYWIFQYTIQDVYSWLYEVKDPEEVLNVLSQGSMRLVAGQTPLDAFLTTEKIEIQEKNKKLFQDYCDEIGLKVSIDEVKLQDPGLPDASVQKAYDEVANAMKLKDANLNEAIEYHNKIVPKARGEAAKLINSAKEYYTTQVNGAKGEILLFEGVLSEYKKDPVTTEQKLWYEAMQEVLPNAKKTIIEDNSMLNIKTY